MTPLPPIIPPSRPKGKEASTSFAVLDSNPHADVGPGGGGAPGLLFSDFGRASAAAHGGSSTYPISGSSNGSSTAAAAAAAAGAAIPRGASLVVCAPHSGRTHQIRVHLAAVGHPIVGDDIYGVTVSGRGDGWGRGWGLMKEAGGGMGRLGTDERGGLCWEGVGL